MKVATINLTTKLVENVIVAAVGYEPPEGLFCVELAEDFPVSIGWKWVEGSTFIDPNPPVEEVAPPPPEELPPPPPPEAEGI